MSMATAQRRDRILSSLVDKTHLTVRDLSAVLAVSEATIRRDLRSLADDGKLTLVHGGATLSPVSGFSFDAKHLRNLDAKKIVGALAAELVTDNDQVFLDSGTTCFEMAAHLRRRRNLSIILNSTRLAIELQGVTQTHHGGGAMTGGNGTGNLSLIMLGGQYRPDRMDTIGPIATSTLEQLRGYQCFIGADGLAMDFGPSAADIDSAHLYRLAIQHARETIVVVDHSKFQSASLFKLVDWPRIQKLVTDQTPDEPWLTFFRGQNIEVIVPQTQSNEEP